MLETENGSAGAMTVPGAYSDKPLPKTVRRELLPSTWVNRTLKLSYVRADGIGIESSGTLLDLCVTGPIFNLSGEKTLIPWERLAALTLVND